MISRILLLLVSQSAYAGYGGMAHPEVDDGGGPFTLASILLGVGYFVGLFWYLSRAADEVAAFMRLATGIVLIITIGSLLRCVG